MVSPPPPPPAPPFRADAADGVIVAIAGPDIAEALIRNPVNPAVLTCQVPSAVAEVTAVVEAKGITLTDDQVVPPSPVASNTTVPVQEPESVSVAPPLSCGKLTTRQFVAVAQSEPPVVILPLVPHARGAIHRARNSSTIDRRFIVPPKTRCPMTPSPSSSHSARPCFLSLLPVASP